MERFVRFCKTLGATEGLETIEYAIISGVIVVAMIVTLDLVGGNRPDGGGLFEQRIPVRFSPAGDGRFANPVSRAAAELS